MNKKNLWGGKRPGAGKKTPNKNRIKTMIKLDPKLKEKLKKIEIESCKNTSDKIEKILSEFFNKHNL